MEMPEMEKLDRDGTANKLDVEKVVGDIQRKYKIVGRRRELRRLVVARKTNKHVLIEGEVGVGKTTLARAVAEYFDGKFYRVDGSEDLMPHALVGYFDPPAVVREGYVEDAYVYGPLARALVGGDCLFINEINRMPENTQNMLLTALDERILEIGRLKTLHASNGFWVVATQNPEAHVGVTALGEALKDRFVWTKLDYQPEEEEFLIVKQEAGLHSDADQKLASLAVKIVRESRAHRDLQRGSSIRGAIDLATVVKVLLEGKKSREDYHAWLEAAVMSLSTKVEVEDGVTRSREEVIEDLVQMVLGDHP
ncbi:MAG: AAA family ATPase [Promethearchaeota archaeon]